MFMKKWLAAGLLLVYGAAMAQTAVAKKDLVNKVLALQQGGIEQTAQAVAERPALQLMQQASMALQTRVAPEKREQIAKDIEADIKKYAEQVVPSIRQHAVQIAPATVGALLEKNFSEKELTELIGIIESPVNRKFAQMGGELQKSLVEQLVKDVQTDIDPKLKALEQSIIAHLALPAPEAPKPAASKPAKGSKK